MTTLPASERSLRRIDSRVARFCDEHGLLSRRSKLLVGVSGGADSTALLLVLSRLAKRRELELSLAHFDHGLREASTADAVAVRRLARSLDLPLLEAGGDVRTVARAQRLSIEEAARKERYAFLSQAAREAGCDFVAVGHTSSDQAETVLMRILRGTGVAGLAAMSPSAAWPFAGCEGLMLLRPLLCLSRRETQTYCRLAGVETVEDESNASTAYTRNRLRNELLPELRRYNPRVEAALVRLADSARQETSPPQPPLSFEVRGSVVLVQRAAAGDLPAAGLRLTLREALRRVSGLQGFSERHIAALERLIRDGRTGDRLDLPRGLQAALTPAALELGSVPRQQPPLPEQAAVLQAPGETRFGALTVSIGEAPPLGAVAAAQVAAAALDGGIVVRRRRDGDRFQPLGMTGTKKLQDFLVDAHVPRRDRDSVPLFETSRGIAWVGGLRIAEWARPCEGAPAVWLSYQMV